MSDNVDLVGSLESWRLDLKNAKEWDMVSQLAYERIRAILAAEEARLAAPRVEDAELLEYFDLAWLDDGDTPPCYMCKHAKQENCGSPCLIARAAIRSRLTAPATKIGLEVSSDTADRIEITQNFAPITARMPAPPSAEFMAAVDGLVEEIGLVWIREDSARQGVNDALAAVESARAKCGNPAPVRRDGHSKLVYNKKTRTIIAVDPHPAPVAPPTTAGPSVSMEQIYKFFHVHPYPSDETAATWLRSLGMAVLPDAGKLAT
jgi:hypothetical protein